MNLIEQLGGYENASKHFNRIEYHAETKIFIGEWFGFYSMRDLKDVLLGHRRKHNIFEVGDVVVGRCYSDFDDALLTITKKFTHDGKPCIVFECTRTICDDFESEVRHAKPEELGAGHRL